MHEFGKALMAACKQIQKASEEVDTFPENEHLAMFYLQRREMMETMAADLHAAVVKTLADRDPVSHKMLTQGDPPPLVRSDGKYLVEHIDKYGEVEKDLAVDNRYEAVVTVRAWAFYLDDNGEGLRLMALGENDHCLIEDQKFTITKL